MCPQESHTYGSSTLCTQPEYECLVSYFWTQAIMQLQGHPKCTIEITLTNCEHRSPKRARHDTCRHTHPRYRLQTACCARHHTAPEAARAGLARESLERAAIRIPIPTLHTENIALNQYPARPTSVAENISPAAGYTPAPVAASDNSQKLSPPSTTRVGS